MKHNYNHINNANPPILLKFDSNSTEVLSLFSLCRSSSPLCYFSR